MSRSIAAILLALAPVLLAAGAEKKEPKRIEIPQFVETGVAGITFVNPETTLAVAGKDSASLLDRRSAFPNIALALCNQDGTEQVILVNQPGDPYLGFSLAVVNKGCGNGARSPRRLAKAKHLVTRRGVRLGMTREELAERLGPNFRETRVKDYTAIRYGVKDIRRYEFLKAFGRMAYTAEYRLKDGKVFSFRFGFENP